ncbi:uncharacterized protein HMPREF1541_05659 [Cyphellophora europaea CBS 101466]|uniref:Ubiquitin-like protein ATG12 n=1 Tax=Cyphellophora europaea (strain CBS 101466) TaxID=1220924 RepID=W2RSF6_CYPE1|nr:uncharacterized protein HMPREF1541_05659 [Cyphellophora europaea CBS 101466]ETN39436.1 hypothetical protein HMPREF1541_05659 [Cyphellophora europaea CBS 101466]
MASNDPPQPSRSPRDDLSESQLLTRPYPPSTSTPPQASPPSSPSPSSEDPLASDHPLSLSTSTLLTTHVPTDARTALSHLSATLDPPTHKITVRFQATGDAPPLKQKVAKVSASHTFAVVVRFLRKRLYGDGGGNQEGGQQGKGKGKGEGEGDGLFCYVNRVFAPGLDEGVGNLWRCFKVDDQLIVYYSRTPAFG